MVLDQRTEVIEAAAAALKLSSHLGDASDHTTLTRIVSAETRFVIVAVSPDETAVMTTMLVRGMCPNVVVVTAVREDDNVDHARRAGANQVVTTSPWAGRALATALD
jgi:voltage-gated potassium channel